MPYVWIDDHECDGFCDRAIDLGEAAKEALAFLREGDTLNAIRTLGKATRDEASETERRKEEELRQLYQDWLEQPRPRPEFLTFAHTRRKATAA